MCAVKRLPVCVKHCESPITDGFGSLIDATDRLGNLSVSSYGGSPALPCSLPSAKRCPAVDSHTSFWDGM
ncbi:hypothetical protein GN956_G883 [Arapaima gigas]